MDNDTKKKTTKKTTAKKEKKSETQTMIQPEITPETLPTSPEEPSVTDKKEKTTRKKPTKKTLPKTEETTETTPESTEAASVKKKAKRIKKRHSGYVALIGRTNVGKSTFLNTIMEAKIAIVSNKPQTTRKQILGIKTTDRGQIIFFDSPGIHVPHFRLNERMMKDVHGSLNDSDIILYVIDITETKKDDFILDMLREVNKPIFLVINKIDKFNKGRILERIDAFKDLLPWAEIVPISALKELNIDLIEDLIFKYLPENDNIYPPEESTIQTQKYYVSEIIREKLLDLMEQELPFTTTVTTEELTDKGNVVYIRAEIYVENRSQKKIVVGKHGNIVKEIGQLARVELEEHFDKKVYIDLFIKIVPNWRNSEIVLSQLEI